MCWGEEGGVGGCEKVLREMWKRVLGCGGRCGKVCWGMGKC